MSLNNKSSDRSKKPIRKAKLTFPSTSVGKTKLKGSILSKLLSDNGIIFENSPTINVSYTASYSPIELPHSNYDPHAFNKSTVSEITITVPLTAHTREEADKLLAIMQFGRTFTKMNFGINDPNRGMPPQILHFSAYGDYVFNRVPVAIKSFTMPLNNDVDYIQTSFNSSVPVKTDLSIVLVFMPTPNKIRTEFTLDKFASGELVKKGYM